MTVKPPHPMKTARASEEATPRRQYRSREDRRRQIIEATLQLLSERGPRNWTIALLAERVGVSEATLFKHFANKDDILLESVGEQVRRTRAWIESLKPERHGWPGVRWFLEEILTHAVATGGGPLILMEQATRFPDSLRKTLDETKLGMHARIEAMLEGSPLMAVSEEVAEIGLAVVTRALLLWGGGDVADPVRQGKAQLAVLEDAFGALAATR